MPTSLLEYKLSPEQLKKFDEEGWLVLENIFTNEELQVVIDAIMRDLDAKAKQAVADGKLSKDYAEHDFEHRLAKINDENQKIASSMWDMQVVLPEFFDLISNKKVVDIAEQLCGSDELIASSVYRLRPKVPRHPFSEVPWHQDSGYFEPSCDNDLILTVWLPLVDATEENGCMWVIPKMHKSGVYGHEPDKIAHYLQLKEEYVNDKSKWVCCPVKKGGAFFVTNRTPHASFENKTDMVRWSMDLRYQAASLPTNAKIKHTTANIKLDGDGVPMSCNPPEPDFLVRSSLHPDQLLKNGEEFLELRRTHTYKAATDRWNYSTANRKEGGGADFSKKQENH
jgi:ectoine hydroxylase-related dioxygenase (phytanoyl-CoA dioxygenase family)